MTYPPGQSFTIRDGGVGLVSEGDDVPVIAGVTSGGVTDTLYQFADPNLLQDTLGQGPAVDLAVPVIVAAGAVRVLKTASSTAGTSGAVTKTAIGSSTGTITVAGTPRNSYRVLIRTKTTGTLGTAKFDYSLTRKPDNLSAYEFSEEITIPAGGTYLIPNTDLTLTFVPGAGPVFFEDGDLHRFDSTASIYTTTNLAAALTALLAQIGTKRIRQFFLSGKHATGADAATMAAALATHMTTLESKLYFGRALMDAGNDTPANVLTGFASFADDRVGICYGDANISSLSPIVGWGTPQVPALNAIAERAAGADLSENLGRFASGPLRGVVAISHDERVVLSFGEADKINTLRTWQGEAGFFATNGYLRSPSGSDFLYYDWGRTIDEICHTVEESQKRWILAKLRALTDGTGRLSKLDAVRVRDVGAAALNIRLKDPINVEGYKGHVSGLAYTVDTTNDYLASRILRTMAAAVPLSPAEQIETIVGFTRSL